MYLALQVGVEPLHGVQVVREGPFRHLPDLAPGDVLRQANRAAGAFIAGGLVAVEDVGPGGVGATVLD